MGKRSDGAPCKANAVDADGFCLWHSSDPAIRERHMEASRRGGFSKAYNAIPAVPPIAARLDLDALDLASAAGVVTLLGATLAGLARLPLDCRVANALGQVAGVQRAAIEASGLEARVAALEAAGDAVPLRRVP